MTDSRPVYLNLFKIRLPITGVVSFAHRVSGFLLFLAIPFSIYIIDLTLASESGFERAMQMIKHPLMQAILLLLVWSFVHHLLAGIRYLALDFDLGIEKNSSKISAMIVLVSEISIIAAYIWGIML
ncbi:MAG: succinate dehydrogenase, cytochrome b556 subunit [Gammaproteobacteria bacterium]|nr:succinate dehydrogenase, cytochrome b556 subunit [Gammaproteobacteria bacterium]NNJ96390.1 succinate dehydrogenase, cytochrome b556 subunit [Gammaproteobacteria bacterium]